MNHGDPEYAVAAALAVILVWTVLSGLVDRRYPNRPGRRKGRPRNPRNAHHTRRYRQDPDHFDSSCSPEGQLTDIPMKGPVVPGGVSLSNPVGAGRKTGTGWTQTTEAVPGGQIGWPPVNAMTPAPTQIPAIISLANHRTGAKRCEERGSSGEHPVPSREGQFESANRSTSPSSPRSFSYVKGAHS